MKVGISGHQMIRPEDAAAWVEATLRDELIASHASAGISCLATGADQIFAAIVLDLGLELEAVIPCKGYASAFSDADSKARYAALNSQAVRRSHLNYPEPSEEAFLHAGQRVVEMCDLMLFVWNGEHAHGRGGTQDILEYARNRAVPYVRLNPSDRSIQRMEGNSL